MPELSPDRMRIVGAARPAPQATRLIETLYKTKTPETSSWGGAYFELTMGKEKLNGQTGYFVRETECRWDEPAKYTVRVQYTLSPRGGFPTIEEARERYKLQRATRARRGFVHSYAPSYDAAKRHRYVCIEVLPEREVVEGAKSQQPLEA
jgi:hypothetical protein